jgi:hypothetical protein
MSNTLLTIRISLGQFKQLLSDILHEIIFYTSTGYAEHSSWQEKKQQTVWAAISKRANALNNTNNKFHSITTVHFLIK